MDKILIVIDAQEDFTRGSLYNEEAIKALPKLHDAIVYASEHFDNPVIFTKDVHYSDYYEIQEGMKLPVSHCIAGTKGCLLCPEVKIDGVETIVFTKSTFGSIALSESPTINHASEIWLCGFCTDICVSANFQILKAAYPEIPITVIADACAGTTIEMHEAALKVMESCQANITTWAKLKERIRNN